MKDVPISSGTATAKRELWRLWSRLKQSAFVRNILVVMTGTAVAQAIGFGLSPVISRLFSPADYGVSGSFDAVASIIATVVTLQYSQAIILPKQEADAANLLAVSCLSTLLFSILCLAACLIAPVALNGLMKTTGVWALVLLVGAIFVSGLNESFQAWCVRTKSFKTTSGSQVVRSLSSNGMQIGSGYLAIGAPGLVVSSVAANFLASLPLSSVVFRNWRVLRSALAWRHLRRMAVEYRDFPFYSATANLINSLSLGLPVLLLTHFYGLAVAGAYAFAIRVLATPMGFVLTALRQVLLQKATEAHNEGRRLMPLYAKVAFGLFAMALLPSLILMLWAPQLFALVFGPRWVLAGDFASSLVLWLLFMFCNAPAALFGRILRLQRQMFLFEMTVLLLRTATLYFGGASFSPSTTILLFSLVGGVLNIVFIGIVGHKLRKAEVGKQNANLMGDLT